MRDRESPAAENLAGRKTEDDPVKLTLIVEETEGGRKTSGERETIFRKNDQTKTSGSGRMATRTAS